MGIVRGIAIGCSEGNKPDPRAQEAFRRLERAEGGAALHVGKMLEGEEDACSFELGRCKEVRGYTMQRTRRAEKTRYLGF